MSQKNAFPAEPQPKFPKHDKPKKEKYYNPLENQTSLATYRKNLQPLKLLAKNQLPKEPEIFQNVRLQSTNFPKR